MREIGTLDSNFRKIEQADFTPRKVNKSQKMSLVYQNETPNWTKHVKGHKRLTDCYRLKKKGRINMLEKLKEHDRENVINSTPLPVVQNLANHNMHTKKNLL